MSDREIHKAIGTGDKVRMVRTGEVEKRSQENSKTLANAAQAQKIVAAAIAKPNPREETRAQ